MRNFYFEVTSEKVTVQLPFCGFYESEITDQIDREDELQREWLFDEYGLDLDNVPGRNWIDIQHSVDFTGIAASYTSFYEDRLDFIVKELYGIDIDAKLEFKAVHSPREYNFYSDILEAEISVDTIRKIYDAADKERFSDFLYEYQKPRSGFIPSYPWKLEEYDPDIGTWPACIRGIFLEFLEHEFDEYGNPGFDFIDEASSHCWINDAIDFKTPEELLEEISFYYDEEDPEDKAFLESVSKRINAA